MYKQIALEYAVMEDIYDIYVKDLSNADSEIYVEPTYEGALSNFFEKIKNAFIKLIEGLKSLFGRKPKGTTKTVVGNQGNAEFSSINADSSSKSSSSNAALSSKSSSSAAAPSSVNKQTTTSASNTGKNLKVGMAYDKNGNEVGMISDLRKLDADNKKVMEYDAKQQAEGDKIRREVINKSMHANSIYNDILRDFKDILSKHVERAFTELSKFFQWMDTTSTTSVGSAKYFADKKKFDEHITKITNYCENAKKSMGIKVETLTHITEDLKASIDAASKTKGTLSFVVETCEFGDFVKLKWPGKDEFMRQLDYVEKELKSAVAAFKPYLDKKNYSQSMSASEKAEFEVGREVGTKFKEAYTPFHSVYTEVYKIMRTVTYNVTMRFS